MKEFADKPPALIEMAKLLPKPGSVFPLRHQLAWLRAFHVAASFCYGFDPDDIEIVIEADADLGADKIVVRRNLKRVQFRPNDHGAPCQGCPGRYPVPAVINQP
jgi:hypothetical protein